MKKLFAQLLAVLVLVSSVALLAGCQKKEEAPPTEPSQETPAPTE